MKITCPSCGAGGSVELFVADGEWRTAIMAAAQLPSDCGVPALRYIGLFRPAKRFLTPDRAATLLHDVCDMIINGAERNRQQVKAPAYVWREALLEMHRNPTISRPLKSHGYLLEVVQSMLTRRSDIDQSERASNRRNADSSRPRTASMQPIADALPANALPDLPASERDAWLKKARELLLSEGFQKKFLIAPLIEQRAKELYADAKS
jgi:hypothetical protein